MKSGPWAGMTWQDWAILVLVLSCAVRGFLRGTVAQVFVVLGLLTGAVGGSWVYGWVAEQWRGAEPALVLYFLRWVVAILSGLAIVALFQWWGQRLGEAVKSGPLAWLDRGVGLAVGAVVGIAVSALAMMVAMTVHPLHAAGEAVARARLATPLMQGGAQACSRSGRLLPGGMWLKQRFLKAEKRARAARMESIR